MSQPGSVALEKTLKILIAEDDANIALALGFLLRRAIGAVAITTVRDGQAALEQLQQGRYDLLVSDWNMPRLTGLELLTRVRADAQTQRLPFLMLTARSDAGSFTELSNADLTGYIGKPFDNDEFIEKVRALLRIV